MVSEPLAHRLRASWMAHQLLVVLEAIFIDIRALAAGGMIDDAAALGAEELDVIHTLSQEIVAFEESRGEDELRWRGEWPPAGADGRVWEGRGAWSLQPPPRAFSKGLVQRGHLRAWPIPSIS